PQSRAIALLQPSYSLVLAIPLSFPATLYPCPFFSYSYRDHRDLHSFPTRRSSDLSPSSATSTCQSRPSTSTAAAVNTTAASSVRSEEHTSELQSRFDLVCRLLLEKKKTVQITYERRVKGIDNITNGGLERSREVTA